MELKEVILSEIPIDVGDATVNRVLMERSLNGNDTYTLERKRDVELVIADLLVIASRNPDFSEGQLSVKNPRGYLRREAIRLYRANGEKGKAATLVNHRVNDASKKW